MRKSGIHKKTGSNIPQFKASDFQRPGITIQQVQQIKEAFDLFDTDQTGFVNPRQLKAALNSLGPEAQNQTIYQIIADLQDDGVSHLDFTQFISLMTARVSQKDTRESVHKIFNLFDDQKTGHLSIKNLRKVVKELGQNIDDNELQEMIERADSDRDGLVSQQQFYHIITKKSLK